MNKILLSTALLATLALTSHAEDVKITPLKTHTEFGYIETNGNTKTKTFNLDATAKKAWDKHEGKINFDGQYAEDSGNETKNKYLLELNYNYTFTDRFAFDYLLGYKVDKFSSYDYQFYTGPGAQYKAIVTEKHKLTLSGNILYAIDQEADTNYADTAKTVVIPYPNPNNTPVLAIKQGKKNDYAAYRLKGVYDYQITKTLKFNQELSIRGQIDDLQNYFGYSKTSLNSKISDIFSAGISYKADYVNEPAIDKEHTDTTLTLNLIIDY
ncbi:probable outer membrane protein STY1784 [hydrothermal vent metagenome]|uniref:Probable outer membrane protein STY1784 n=1 Tax=hydrothermal vent metagenome TaxID=652676 RepID=A0A1W1BP00_9ZZZZ